MKKTIIYFIALIAFTLIKLSSMAQKIDCDRYIEQIRKYNKNWCFNAIIFEELLIKRLECENLKIDKYKSLIDNLKKYSRISSDLNIYSQDGLGWGRKISDGKAYILGMEFEPKKQLDYNGLGAFNESGLCFAVRKDGSYTYIDKKGNEVADLNLVEAWDFSEGLASVEVIVNGESKCGYLGITGGFWIPPLFDKANDFKEGLAAVKLKNNIGFINKSGEMVIQNIYEIVYDFSEGLAGVMRNKKWVFIDKKGSVAINAFFEDDVDSSASDEFDHYEFKEGLAAAKKNGKYGFINKKGEFEIKPIYDDAATFVEGLARVKVKGKIGYINKAGKKVIDCQYDAATDFIFGNSHVKKGNSEYYIDRKGNIEMDIDKDGFPDFMDRCPNTYSDKNFGCPLSPK